MLELKGLSIAQKIREEIRAGVAKQKADGVQPKLTVVQVGDDPGSVWYAKSKKKLGEDLDIEVDIREFPNDTAEDGVVEVITRQSEDPATHGILVELPLPPTFRKSRVLEAINPLKDVDCVTLHNRGLLFSGLEDQALLPATPLACLRLLEEYGEVLQGKKVTLVGRGETVGRPLIIMLVKRNATVTVCHTKTSDLGRECHQADVLITAAGRAGLITREMVTPSMVVVDAGVAQRPDGSYVGDVDYQEVSGIVRGITPVPGGVGTLTTTLIMKNVLKALDLQTKQGRKA